MFGSATIFSGSLLNGILNVVVRSEIFVDLVSVPSSDVMILIGSTNENNLAAFVELLLQTVYCCTYN